MFIIQTMQLWIPDELSTSSAFSIQLAKVRILSDIFDLSTTNALSFVRSSENTFRVLSDVVFFSAVEEGQFTSLKWQHLNLQLLWNCGRPSLQFSSYQSRKKVRQNILHKGITTLHETGGGLTASNTNRSSLGSIPLLYWWSLIVQQIWYAFGSLGTNHASINKHWIVITPFCSLLKEELLQSG